MPIKILLLWCAVMACNQNVKTDNMKDAGLYGHWINSHEENDEAKKHIVYRPAEYDFPPARGREGFEIKENGIFISHPIAPYDGNMSITEKWAVKDDVLIITGEKETRRYRIISLARDKIVLQPM
jgi:hypothetical protein